MQQVFEAAIAHLKAGESACMATIIAVRGSTPRGVGAKMLVRADGSIVGTIGGGAMEGQAISDAQEAIRQGQSLVKHYSLQAHSPESLAICGGEADVFLEVLTPIRQLVVIGGGHIALFLAQMGPILGYNTIIVDDREPFANDERFPTASQTLVAAPDAWPETLTITAHTYIVIATRGHQHDGEALKAALDTPAAYIGLIGSRTKIRAVFQRLQKEGVSAQALSRVYTPVGLDIGSDTPAEIALSVLAEMLLVQRGGTGRPLSERGNPLWQGSTDGR